MKTERVKYLRYIEETRKQHKILDEAAKRSSKKAIVRSLKHAVPITYLEGELIFEENADGEKKVVGRVENNRIKVIVGEKATLSSK